jgi:hypothetical protein
VGLAFVLFLSMLSDQAIFCFLLLLLFSLSTVDTGRLTFSTMCKHSDDIPIFFFLVLYFHHPPS